MQNLAARLALKDWHSPSHILLSKLHWLPVLSRIKFKISSLTYKLLNDHQPGYLSSLISPYTPVRSLRSSDMSLLTQPLARLSIGRRAFSVCAPRLWNALPLSIRSATSRSSFKRSLKTHLFQTLTPSCSLAIAQASDSAIGRYLFIYRLKLFDFFLFKLTSLNVHICTNTTVQICVLLLLLFNVPKSQNKYCSTNHSRIL